MRVLQTHALPLGYRAIRFTKQRQCPKMKNPPARASGGGLQLLAAENNCYRFSLPTPKDTYAQQLQQ
jgi:hypothetical protein